MELTIQLGIIFMGKQFLLSILEYYMPLMWKILNLMKLAGLKKEVDDFNLCVLAYQHNYSVGDIYKMKMNHLKTNPAFLVAFEIFV